MSISPAPHALQVANYFEIGQEDAYQIAYEVGTAVTSWRSIATNLGIPTRQNDRMASAFEHTDKKKALEGKPIASPKPTRKGKQN